MLIVETTTRFQKDFKLMERRNKDMAKLRDVISLLATQNTQMLLNAYRDHPLKGSQQGFRECHIEPNWLLIYRLSEDSLILTRTGTHSDLFE